MILKGTELEFSRQNRAILKGINFSFEQGDIVTLVGPSGAGKSTLLTLLNRLADPDKGEIYFKGAALKGYNVTELRRRIGLVLQQPVLFSGTVEDNVLFGPSLKGIKGKEIAGELLELVGLPADYANRKTDNLSGGEKQRVSLARTMANNPEVLLLDEPTSALDPGAAEHIEQTVLTLNREKGVTAVWVTHNLEQARRVGTRTLLLVNGELIEDKPTSEFFAHPEKELTRRFIDGDSRPGRDVL